jgi:hypothetical protein
LQARDARAASATFAAERDHLRQNLQRLEIRLQSARADLKKMEQKTVATPESGALRQTRTGVAATEERVAKREPASRRPNPQALIANDPKRMAEYLKNFRDSLDGDGRMFKALRMTPEQIEKYKDVEVWLEETRMDLHAAIEQQGIERGSAEYKKLWEDYNKTRLPKKAEALGNLAEAYAEYRAKYGVRWYASQLAWASTYLGETITAQQIERATDILDATSRRRVPENLAVPEDTINWPAARDKLVGTLSPAQIETLGFLIEKRRTQDRANELTNRLTAQFKKQSPAK